MNSPLKARREALGFTLRDVEAITEGAVSNAYLSQLENGKIKNPGLHIVLSLSAAYVMPMEEVAKWFGVETKIVPPRICGECGQALPLQFVIDAKASRHD